MHHPFQYLAALLLAATCAAPALAQSPLSAVNPDLAELELEEPLYRQSPFDLVTLNKQEGNDGKTYKVLPIAFAGRVVPPAAQRRGWIDVRIVDDPDTPYQLDLGQVSEIRLFEQLLFERLKALVAAKRFDQAFHYLAKLRRDYPNTPRLDQIVQGFLSLDARHARAAGRLDDALASANELYSLNPKFPGLDDLQAALAGELIRQRVTEGNYAAARGLVRQLAAKFPGRELPAVQKWNALFAAEAAKSLAAARQRAAAGDYSAARTLAGRALRTWPSDEAGQLLTAIHKQYPQVVVAVSSPWSPGRRDRLTSAAARRTGRLLHRTLLELRGHSAEGGQYQCPLGQLSRDEEATTLTIQLRPGITAGTGERNLAGSDVARALLALSDPASETYRSDWAELLGSVSVKGVFEVQIELSRPHVRPDGFLNVVVQPIRSDSDGALPPPGNGPYAVAAADAAGLRLVARRDYFAATSNQPREIVERYFPRPADAVAALRRGEVTVLDRVSPADLPSLRNSPAITVDRYRAPTVHALVPNFRKPFTANRTFRRALVYGIDRERILREDVLAGAQPLGSQVVSGPFPYGEGPDDPVGMAYQADIQPLGYDRRVSLMLANLALEEIRKTRTIRGEAVDGIPTLLLAHPPLASARAACQAIQEQLRRVDIPVTLHELRQSDAAAMGDKYDLLYVELATWEPAVDARPLLGEEGIAGGSSPYMGLALRRLEQATGTEEFRNRIHAVHRIAHDDVAVIPLWQMYDHFAYRNSLRGIGKRPMLLYENVEAWETSVDIPAESP